MNINETSSLKLKQILNKKQEELKKFYESDEYLWLLDYKDIEEKYYESFIKYKAAYYKKKKINIYLNEVLIEIDSIKKELESRGIRDCDRPYKKIFDNPFNL